MAQPSWRKIEAALIELLREEGFELEQVQGETSVTLYTRPPGDDYEYEHRINLEAFAKELEQRI